MKAHAKVNGTLFFVSESKCGVSLIYSFSRLFMGPRIVEKWMDDKRTWWVPDKRMKNRLWLWMNERGEGKKVGPNLSFFLKSRESSWADFSCDNDDESQQLSDVDNMAEWMDIWMDEIPQKDGWMDWMEERKGRG